MGEHRLTTKQPQRNSYSFEFGADLAIDHSGREEPNMYLVAWLLGVPLTVLVVIYLIRNL